MAYIKQIWEDLPSTNTPITAERLNYMENGIEKAHEESAKDKIVFELPQTAISTTPNPAYYLLAKIAPTGNDNGGTLRINGFMGGYLSTEKVSVDLIISNRGGLNVYGSYIGTPSGFSFSSIKIYEQTNGEHWVYYARTENYTGPVILNLEANLYSSAVKELFNSTENVEPQGTLVKTVDNNVLQLNYESGWTNATLGNNFQLYDSNIPVKYRKNGNLVMLSGVVKPITEIVADGGDFDARTITTLPSGFRPLNALCFLCQGSSRNIWLLTIYPSGRVTASRYGTTSVIPIPTTAWMPFDVTFLVD